MDSEIPIFSSISSLSPYVSPSFFLCCLILARLDKLRLGMRLESPPTDPSFGPSLSLGIEVSASVAVYQAGLASSFFFRVSRS